MTNLKGKPRIIKLISDDTKRELADSIGRPQDLEIMPNLQVFNLSDTMLELQDRGLNEIQRTYGPGVEYCVRSIMHSPFETIAESGDNDNIAQRGEVMYRNFLRRMTQAQDHAANNPHVEHPDGDYLARTASLIQDGIENDLTTMASRFS